MRSLSVKRLSERGQPCPRESNSMNSRPRLSALLSFAGSWFQCAILESWKLPLNRAVVGQPSWLPVLRASLPAEHLGGRDAARTGRRDACPTLSAATGCAARSKTVLQITQPHLTPSPLHFREPLADWIKRRDHANPNQIDDRQTVAVTRGYLRWTGRGW